VPGSRIITRRFISWRTIDNRVYVVRSTSGMRVVHNGADRSPVALLCERHPLGRGRGRLAADCRPCGAFGDHVRDALADQCDRINAFNVADFKTSMAGGNPYTCGANAFWASPFYTTSPGVPINRTGVHALAF
jgi:hypothetical protein